VWETGIVFWLYLAVISTVAGSSFE